MENKEKTETTFLLRIDKDIKKVTEDKARKENRSLNGHILNLIQKDNSIDEKRDI